nr:MAG TPA: hypothetical protein [Caudoviricetes sp.]
MILFTMYTSRTGIVYIYRGNTIASYSLMCSTHTARPKIKTSNLSTLTSTKKFHPHPTSQIV